MKLSQQMKMRQQPLLSKKLQQAVKISQRPTLDLQIAEEDSKNPLSDVKIAGILCQHGIKIARRAITKYRNRFAIASSHERKALSYDYTRWALTKENEHAN
jgi:DNA-directed RNA polymerase specialized sigma54-like protein